MFLCSQQLFTRTLRDRFDLLSGTPQFGGIACISLSCDLFDVFFFFWVGIRYLLFLVFFVEFFRECAVSLLASVDPSIDK
jgi:hypothetical protein